MLLSKLVYLSIKNVIYNNDSSFTYGNFMNGSFDNDIELSLQINNAFSPLNEAIARLSDLDRIPFRYEPVYTKEVDLETFLHPVKDIIGVFNFKAVPFKQIGNTLVLLEGDKGLVEYKENIKTFSKDDLVPLVYDEDDGSYEDKNIDLKVYGISESACAYIIEYVKGKLLEPIAPEMANFHISTAENYFMNLMPNRKSSQQSAVQPKFVIGE